MVAETYVDCVLCPPGLRFGRGSDMYLIGMDRFVEAKSQGQ